MYSLLDCDKLTQSIQMQLYEKQKALSDFFFFFFFFAFLKFRSKLKHFENKDDPYVHKNIFACLFSIHNAISLSRHESDCGNSQAVYFGESKRSLKLHSDEHKRSVRNRDCDKNKVAKHCWEVDHNFKWDQKKVIGRESRSIPRKIKETIPSLNNPNHIKKIPYMLPEI